MQKILGTSENNHENSQEVFQEFNPPLRRRYKVKQSEEEIEMLKAFLEIYRFGDQNNSYENYTLADSIKDAALYKKLNKISANQ